MWPSFSPLGSEGYPIVGETPNFLNDMMAFMQRRIVRYGAIFRTHLLGKRTIIATSYEGVLDVLQRSPILHANTAYSEFLSVVYPNDNFLFARDDIGCRVSTGKFLQRALEENLCCYQTPIHTAISRRLTSITTENDKELGLYEICKPLAEDALLVALFGPELTSKEARRLRTLASDHLNGVVTTSVSLYTRRRAQRAHRELAAFIRSQIMHRKSNCDDEHATMCRKADVHCVLDVAKMMIQSGEVSTEAAVNSMLVLTSAIIAKAIASAASSCLTFLAKDRDIWDAVCRICRGEKDERFAADLLDKTIMESVRLMPPLAGVIRMCSDRAKQDESRASPDSYRVWGSVIHANRDASAYRESHKFRPSRWSNCPIREGGSPVGGCPFAWPGEEVDAFEPKLPLTFGSGVRRCKGRELGWMIVREIVGSVVLQLDSLNCTRVPEQVESTEALEAPTLHSVRIFPVVRLANDQPSGVGPRQC